MEKIFNSDGSYYFSTQDDKKIEILTTNTTLTANDSGKTFYIGTDALVITLPSTVENLEYKFVNIGADGNNIITISPAAADGIHGTATLAASVVELSGTDNKDLINTKSTATTGNCVKLTGDGIIGWYASDFQGIWASE
ncbi:MAG: hypothetical protein GY849_02350 [Deltaproteobacteria bacterium]|nr:hypothetical protein [Deltaproteobacteria bacterium]